MYTHGYMQRMYIFTPRHCKEYPRTYLFLMQVETCTYHYAVQQEFFEADLEQSFSFEADVEVNCDTGIGHVCMHVHVLCRCNINFPFC